MPEKNRRADRVAAIDVMAKVAEFIRPDMPAILSITSGCAVHVQLDTYDPEDGREVAEVMHLTMADPRDVPPAPESNWPGSVHYVWEGRFRDHWVRVVVVRPLTADQAAERAAGPSPLDQAAAPEQPLRCTVYGCES